LLVIGGPSFNKDKAHGFEDQWFQDQSSSQPLSGRYALRHRRSRWPRAPTLSRIPGWTADSAAGRSGAARRLSRPAGVRIAPQGSCQNSVAVRGIAGWPDPSP